MTGLAMRTKDKKKSFFLPTSQVADKVNFRGTSVPRSSGVTVHVPVTGTSTAPLVVSIPHDQLLGNAVFGAMLCSAIPRTQGVYFDQHRFVLLTLARNWGQVLETQTDVQEPSLGASESLTDVLVRLRSRAGLPAAEIARMVGIQRRQLYNLVDGGSTTAERERRIRALAHVVDRLFERFNDVEFVRSALLAPIETDLRSFVDLASEGGEIAAAGEKLDGYLDRRGGAPRRYVQTPRRARTQEQSSASVIEDTLDISPDAR